MTFEWLKLLGITVVIGGVVLISLSKVNGNSSSLEETNNSNNKNSLEINSESSTLNEEDSNVSESKTKVSKFVIGIIFAILAAFTWAGGTTLIKFGLLETDVDIIPINAAPCAK